MSPSLARVHRDTPPVLFLILIPCAFSSGCAGASPREAVTPAQAHMFAHFDRATAAHDALVRGELDRAREAAEWIAEHQEPRSGSGTPPELQMQMQSLATQVSLARSLPEANRAAAQMGRTCGECHAANGVEPRFLIGTAPPEGTGPQAEMARHVWAAERMWEGLVGPGDHQWRYGAEALRGGWLDPQDVVANPEDRARIRALVRQVYELGTQAEGTTDREARADLYGEFLNTCYECHLLTAAHIRQ